MVHWCVTKGPTGVPREVEEQQLKMAEKALPGSVALFPGQLSVVMICLCSSSTLAAEPPKAEESSRS